MGECQDCQFYRIDGQDLRQGSCRRDTPKAFVIIGPQGPMTLGVWPPVKVKDGCAQWQGKVKQ